MSITPTPDGSCGTEEVSQVLVQLVRTFVSYPEEVRVDASYHTNTIVLRVRVSPIDVGKVVGKNGRTAHALRIILAAVSHANGQRFALDIEEFVEK